MNAAEFAALIKAKYPGYANVPDDELVSKILDKYPQYRSRVEMPAPTLTGGSYKPTVMDRVKEVAGIEDALPGAVASVYKDYAVGAAKGLGSAAVGLGEGINKGTGALYRFITGELPPTYGATETGPVDAFGAAQEALAAKNGVQSGGKFIGEAAPWLALGAATAGTGPAAAAARLAISPVGLGVGTAGFRMAQGRDPIHAAEEGALIATAGAAHRIPGVSKLPALIVKAFGPYFEKMAPAEAEAAAKAIAEKATQEATPAVAKAAEAIPEAVVAAPKPVPVPGGTFYPPGTSSGAFEGLSPGAPPQEAIDLVRKSMQVGAPNQATSRAVGMARETISPEIIQRAAAAEGDAVSGAMKVGRTIPFPGPTGTVSKEALRAAEEETKRVAQKILEGTATPADKVAYLRAPEPFKSGLSPEAQTQAEAVVKELSGAKAAPAAEAAQASDPSKLADTIKNRILDWRKNQAFSPMQIANAVHDVYGVPAADARKMVQLVLTAQ